MLFLVAYLRQRGHQSMARIATQRLSGQLERPRRQSAPGAVYSSGAFQMTVQVFLNCTSGDYVKEQPQFGVHT